jgi:hypothetical protein
MLKLLIPVPHPSWYRQSRPRPTGVQKSRGPWGFNLRKRESCLSVCLCLPVGNADTSHHKNTKTKNKQTKNKKNTHTHTHTHTKKERKGKRERRGRVNKSRQFADAGMISDKTRSSSLSSDKARTTHQTGNTEQRDSMCWDPTMHHQRVRLGPGNRLGVSAKGVSEIISK